jgi:hypothetical protein
MLQWLADLPINEVAMAAAGVPEAILDVYPDVLDSPEEAGAGAGAVPGRQAALAALLERTARHTFTADVLRRVCRRYVDAKAAPYPRPADSPHLVRGCPRHAMPPSFLSYLKPNVTCPAAVAPAADGRRTAGHARAVLLRLQPQPRGRRVRRDAPAS